ncbi:MAG: radical SAM family heme chaperone HemW [Rudaea sp.]
MIAPDSIPLSLYIHIPWCVRKCPYCDFNSHNAPQTLPQSEYIDALLRDLDQDVSFARGRMLQSIFFGGGTPSLFMPDQIARILDGASLRLEFARDIEITLETNPGTVEHGPFAGYRKAGVNRISFGVQSFDDGALKRIGRIHDANEAERAIKMAQDAGISNINLDLMYALPDQSIEGALADIDKAIALQTPHVSHYQLTLEPNTAFAANPPPLPDDDSAWDMQEACLARLAEAGLAQYEVSAYAKAGKQCRHNLNYWNFGDYLGIGAGAHAKLTQADGTIHRRWKVRSPNGFLEYAGSARGVGGDDVVARDRIAFEYMLNALRLNAGFDLGDFESRTGLMARDIEATLAKATSRGLIAIDGKRVRASEFGQRFLNDTIGLFLADTPSRRSAA